jgi:hypothetical protein
MTVSAVEATGRPDLPVSPRRRQSVLQRVDRLIPIGDASRLLGYSADTLRRWHDEGHMPAVITPGGQWSTYESFIHAVLASARPKQAGSIEEIARGWFAARAPEVA